MSPNSKRRRLVAENRKDPRDELHFSMKSMKFQEENNDQNQNDNNLRVKKGKKKGASKKE